MDPEPLRFASPDGGGVAQRDFRFRDALKEENERKKNERKSRIVAENSHSGSGTLSQSLLRIDSPPKSTCLNFTSVSSFSCSVSQAEKARAT